VNHEIQDHVHLHAPLAKRGETVDFKEERGPNSFADGHKCGIKPLQVSHLENPAAGSGGSYKVFCFPEGGGYGLFEKDVASSLQECPGDGKMLIRGNNDAHSVHSSYQIVIIRIGNGSKLFRPFLRSVPLEIHQSDKFDFGDFGVFLRVELSEIPHPNNGGSYRFSGFFYMPTRHI
jgi:hypothetical protein